MCELGEAACARRAHREHVRYAVRARMRAWKWSRASGACGFLGREKNACCQPSVSRGDSRFVVSRRRVANDVRFRNWGASAQGHSENQSDSYPKLAP